MNDALLAVKINAKLAVDPLVSSVDISVSCNSDAVTLTGNVDNYAQRIHVETLAASVADVKVVHNQLAVGEEDPVTAPGMTTPDALNGEEIEAVQDNVRQVLAHQLGSVAEEIDVEVQPGGIAVLRGQVPSELFKRSAEDVIWPLPKVTWIVNQLVYGTEQDEASSTDPDRLSSAIAGTKLNARLIGQGLIKEAFGVKAIVLDDAVHLQGDVDNWYFKQKIYEIGCETFDRSVQDEMTVTEGRDVEAELGAIPESQVPVQPIYHHTVPPYQHYWYMSSNALLEVNEDIRRRLADKYGRDAEKIQVRVDRLGTAFVVGKVASMEEIVEAENIVWEVRGVRHIINGIRATAEK